MDNFVLDDDEFEDDTLEIYNDDEVDLERTDSNAKSISPTESTGNKGSDGDRLDPHRKRICEESRGITIEKELQKQKIAKLAMAVDANLGKPVKKNGKKFNNLLAST
ncbi:hypothetical protein PanWU01x14_156100 [Parasponia andersonii]|uniref:Uncharacterized protein n=1 Tax=Parasponia andersonii TaxID=3476 RepID=A0A2P5CFR1_PARAD|nr:hypothetical protein PanWU01x14_156100 [Parasponia andersonii]